MIPKEAIEKARASGWKEGLSDTSINLWLQMDEAKYSLALDPSFWQSLGKALGWLIEEREWHGREPILGWMPTWRLRALQFYDLILTGGDTRVFWDDILATNKLKGEGEITR